MLRILSALSAAATLTAGLAACDPTTPTPGAGGYDECPATDAFASVPSASIVGDTLTATVAHSGCDQADVAPCWDGSFMESFPVQVSMDLSIGEAQACAAYFEYEVDIDLTPLKQAYEDGYNSESGSIWINLEGTRVLYEF